MWFWHYKQIPLGNDFQVFLIFDILFFTIMTLFLKFISIRIYCTQCLFPPHSFCCNVWNHLSLHPILSMTETGFNQPWSNHPPRDHGICTASSHLAEAVVCNMVAGWLFAWKSLSTRDTEIVLKGRLAPETLGCLCCRLLDNVVLLTDVIPDQRRNANSSFQCKDSTFSSVMDWRWSGIETPY